MRFFKLHLLPTSYGRILPPQGGWPRSNGDWGRVACAAGACMLVSLLALSTDRVMGSLCRPVHTASTEIGERRLVTPQVGVSALLNTHSKICWCQARPILPTGKVTTRLVLQQGEGLFTVSPGAHGDLVVGVGDWTLRHLGTSFDARRLDDGTMRFTVREGAISVTGSTTAILQANQVATSIRGSQALQVKTYTAAQIQDQLSWQKGQLTLSSSPLQEAGDEMARYHKTDVRIARAIRDRQVALNLDLSNLCNFAHAMHDLYSDVHPFVDESDPKHPILLLDLPSQHPGYTPLRLAPGPCSLP